MHIYLTKDIANPIIDQISKFFKIGSCNSKNSSVRIGQSTLRDVLISSRILDEAEYLFKNNLLFSASINPVCVNNNIMAVILKINVHNSIDIDFIFKAYETEIIFKDSLYWKSFYFFNKRELQVYDNIYEDVDADIISYMMSGQYVHENVDISLNDNLIEFYRKGESNFKNLLLLNDMIKI